MASRCTSSAPSARASNSGTPRPLWTGPFSFRQEEATRDDPPPRTVGPVGHDAGDSAALGLRRPGRTGHACAVPRRHDGDRRIAASRQGRIGRARATNCSGQGHRHVPQDAGGRSQSLVRVRLELARAFYLKGEDSLARRHFEAGPWPASVPDGSCGSTFTRFLAEIRARKPLESVRARLRDRPRHQHRRRLR